MTKKIAFTPEYQAFVDKYGERPADIVFGICQKVKFEAVKDAIEETGAKDDANLSALISQAVAEAVKKERERILNQMALEKCDSDVMPYFEDYYYLPKSVWQSLQQG